MRLLKYLVIAAASTMVMSSLTHAELMTKHDHAPIVFQVIQTQMNIDSSMIQGASLIDNNGKYGGLEIVLKPSAASELKRITKAGVGRIANLEINDKVMLSAKIRSPLDPKFVVSGITKDEAQAFIDALKTS